MMFSFFLQTCGVSNGLIPMLRVFNSSVRYIDQGACRVRSFSFLIFAIR